MVNKKLKILLGLFLLVPFILSVSPARLGEKRVGCSGSGGAKRGWGGGGGGGNGNVDTHGFLLFDVKDASFLSPLSSARILVNGTEVASTSERGVAYFGLYSGDYKVEIRANGYAPAFLKVKVLKDTLSRYEVKLIPVSFSVQISAAEGGEVFDRVSGTKIIFPPGGLKKIETGEIYSGPAVIKISYLDPDNPRMVVGGGGDAELLETFGPINVDIVSLSGEPLDIPDGATAVVEFPVPNGLREKVPNTMYLWSFDRESGEWKYEGVLEKIQRDDGREVWRGVVSHFSWWNPDVPSDTTCIKGTLKDSMGNAIVGVHVWSEGIDYTGADFTGLLRKISDTGRFFVFVKKGGKARVLTDFGGGKIVIGQVDIPYDCPSYYLKDWISDPASAWTSCCYDMGDAFVADEIALILRWGNKKCDLDFHITGPSGGGSGRFHVATKVWGRKNINPYVKIVDDDYPEEATIRPDVAGVYRVSVYHNNPSDTSCGRLLKDSGALIQVWRKGRIIGTFSPPPSGSGNIWKVIDIVVGADGNITISPLSQIVSGDYCSPYHPDPAYETACPINSLPSISAVVPSEVEGGSHVFIPYSVSDPDGDEVSVEAYIDGGGGERGRASVGGSYIFWAVPDVRDTVQYSIRLVAYDTRGGRAEFVSTVQVNPSPSSSYKVWEVIELSPQDIWFSSFDVDSDGSIFVIEDSLGGSQVVKIAPSGRIVLRRNIGEPLLLSVFGDSVYVVARHPLGYLVVERYTKDLSSVLWSVQVTSTTSQLAAYGLEAENSGIYVLYRAGCVVFLSKYSYSGDLIWQRLFSSTACQPQQGYLGVDEGQGILAVSFFDDTSGTDYARLYTINASDGSIIASLSVSSWAGMPVYPVGTSLYAVWLWQILRIYDLNFNLIHSVNLAEYFPSSSCSCNMTIGDIRFGDGRLYAIGSRSLYEEVTWLRDDPVFFIFDLGLRLIYHKVVGLDSVPPYSSAYPNYRNGGIRTISSGSSTYLFIAGGFRTADSFYYQPFAVKYRW